MRSARFYGGWLLILVALPVIASLSVLTLMPVDETRYAGVALEMWQSGEWLVPVNNGEFYSHKPPLLFWLMQLGWWLTGVGITWPRVMTALFSLVSLGLTAQLARQLWPNRPGIAPLAAAIVAGSLLWCLWIPAIMFDGVLSCWVLVGMVGIASQIDRPGHTAGPVLLALAIGLGLLTKGPVIVLHLLPPALLMPAVLSNRSVGWRECRSSVLALIGGIGLALLWAIPAALHGGPDYTRAIFWGQSAGRMVDSFAHAQPVWWYLAGLPLVLFPWSIWLPVWRAIPTLRRSGDQGTRLILAWLLPVFVSLSLISGKQFHYLLPLLPAFGLLLARILDQRQPRRSRADAVPVALVLLTAAVLTGWASTHPDPRWPGWVADIPLWTPVGLVLLAGIALIPARWLIDRAMIQATVTALLLVVVAVGIARPALPWYDLTPAATVVASAQRANRPVAHVGNYHNRLRFLGRLEQPVAVIGKSERTAWACAHPDGLLIDYGNRSGDSPIPAVLEQPFRGRWLRIVRAGDLLTPDHGCVSDRSS